MMTVGEALTSAMTHIAHRDAQILLSSLLGSNTAHLIAYPEACLTTDQVHLYQNLVLRCAKGEPVAYLLGEKSFWDFSLKVTSDTLIPRPETETIIETVIRYADKKQALSLVDMGTGSGAIAIALARLSPNWSIDAVEYSALALQVAKENAAHLNANIAFYKGAWYAALPAEKMFDWIISNPPYIDPLSAYLKQPCLAFEPSSALVAGENGLSDLRELITQAPKHLKSGGYICLEHGYDQSDAVESIAAKAGFTLIEAVLDIHDIRRVYLGQLVHP